MSIQSLVSCGTKVWLDSVDPDAIARYHPAGVSGATSNPIIIAELIESGICNEEIGRLLEEGRDDQSLAWELTDRLVIRAQETFMPVWARTRGNDGYVSFELDPLLEDNANPLPHAHRVRRYVDLAHQWSSGHSNRMIKVPATGAGLAALEEIAAGGIAINVTLLFTRRQYEIARDAIWRGAQRRRHGLGSFKSVYSIFVSRIDIYTQKHVPQLSPAAQGMVGIVNARRLWQLNHYFWIDKHLSLQQELIFASTGTKDPGDPADKYVAALAGSDIQTNPPATLDAVEHLNKEYRRTVDAMPPREVLDEIDQQVDVDAMEMTLMEEGTRKFAQPQHALLDLIARKRGQLAATR